MAFPRNIFLFSVVSKPVEKRFVPVLSRLLSAADMLRTDALIRQENKNGVKVFVEKFDFIRKEWKTVRMVHFEIEKMHFA